MSLNYCFLSTFWNEWINSRQIPTECEENFRCERLLPAFLQLDMCLARLAFPKLNAGIAIPTANINKRAGIIKDNYNLVFILSPSVSEFLSFFLSLLVLCLFSLETTSVNFALLNVLLCQLRPTWNVSLSPKHWHLVSWLSSQYV